MKKALDVKSIVAESFNKAQEQHGLNKKAVEEARRKAPAQTVELAPSKAKKSLYDIFPFLKIKESTFEREKPSRYQPVPQDEALFRDIFAKFVVKDDVGASITNLNRALSISITEDLEIQFYEQPTKVPLNQRFSSLSIMNVMYYASQTVPQMGGLLFEPIVAGLLRGTSIGVGGKSTDIKVMDGNKDSISEYTLKTMGEGGDFDLSIIGLVDRARELFKDESANNNIRLLVVLKHLSKPKGGNDKENLFYVFYEIEIKSNNILNVVYKRQRGEDATENIKTLVDDYFYGILRELNKKLKKQPEDAQRLIKKINQLKIGVRGPRDFFRKLNSFEASITDEAEKALYKQAKNVASGVKTDEKTDEKPSAEIPKGTNENLDEAKDPGKGAVYKSATTPKGWATTLRNKYKVNPVFKGAVLLSDEYFQELERGKDQLLTDIKALLEPLATMMSETNNYFISDDRSLQKKMTSLGNAQAASNEFQAAVQKAMSDQNQAAGQTNESKDPLNLSPEAAIVMEMLQRMEE